MTERHSAVPRPATPSGSMTTPPAAAAFPSPAPPTSVTLGRMSDVTHLLDVAAAGDRRAAADLLPLVYDELRKLAAAEYPSPRNGMPLARMVGRRASGPGTCREDVKPPSAVADE